jgi:hypothetical protein
MGAAFAILIIHRWIPQDFSKEVILLMAITLILNYRLIKKGRYAA